MRDITIDFETYYDREYSLSKMTMQEYIEDPRFQTMGVAIIEDTAEARWVDGPDAPAELARIDWANANMIGHNLLFDGAVLAHHYGLRPKLYSCTLCYARAVMGAMLPKFSLEVVAAAFNMRKDVGALLSLMGMHYEEVITPEHALAWERYKRYATSDAIQSKTIYNFLKPHMPDKERVVVDILMRMFIDGKLVLDPLLLHDAWEDARLESAQKLAAAGITDVKQLRSRGEFAQKLIDLGVNPPMKLSQATKEMTYAFSKDDLPFLELLEHEDPRVRLLVEAKLNASSTLAETRAKRLHNIATASPTHTLMVPLAYSGAHTHRFSGLDKLNLQNLPRSTKIRRNKLRYAIQAPKGYLLVVRDASQIEARLLAFVAGQWDLVAQFAQGIDVYASFASSVYGRLIDKYNDPGERFIGKTGILGLGYGSGPITFHHMVLTSDYPISIDDTFATKVVNTYRAAYPQIRRFWGTCDRALIAMERDQTTALGPCYTGSNRLTLPSGLHLTYPMLEEVPKEERLHPDWGLEWRYYKPKYRAYANIFGAKVCENVIQALARIQITDTMLKMRVTNPDWHCALQVHDELVYVVPEDEAELADAYLEKYLNDQPAWAEGSRVPVPLANEGGIGKIYGDIK